jgi:hypothetical protein
MKYVGALLLQDVDEINAFLASAKEGADKYLREAASVGLITLSQEVEEQVEQGEEPDSTSEPFNQ